MAQVVISPLLDVLIGNLDSALKEEVGLTRGVSEELDNLSQMLSNIQADADVEERQITDGALKKCLAELKDVAYDADDMLDEFAYEALQRKLMESADETKNGVCNFFLSRSLSSLIPSRGNVVLSKIKEINKKVDRISRDIEVFHPKKGEIRQIPDTDRQPLSNSLIENSDQSDFFGRDNDIKRIMNLLMFDEDASDGGTVISIVGMGGLGKTTLAQLVYNNENVQKHFQVRAWVYVSDQFDISRLTREIIESATGERCSSSEINYMQTHLKKILFTKRFLIVLDDVWNTDHSAWDRLRSPFIFGAKGSKILVTTQNEAVAKTMNAYNLYRLELLSDDDCLSLFLRHAFIGDNTYGVYSEYLMEIGKDLVKSRCQGLPLAAKELGDLLSSKREENFWRSILNSPVWRSKEGENEVMKAMRVSYHHLPPHIKQCFAFCSIFPKDYKFKKDTLVKLWMAQGFIPLEEGFRSRTLEAIGSEYFNCLLSRFFFQLGPGYENRSNYYKMHACIHDLAMLVSSDECFRFEHGKPTCIPERGHRHSSFIVDRDNNMLNLKDLYECKGLRTVIIHSHNHINNQILRDLIMNLKCLRVMVLKNSGITELPSLISNLKHLRYLDLSSTKITQLPESVTSLYNLQTLELKNSGITELPGSISNLRSLHYLDLSLTKIMQLPESMSSLYYLQTLDLTECLLLCELPKETRKLVNLRHLHLDWFLSLESMPPKMGRLIHLQTLPRFIVSRERGCGIGELKGLRELKGAISIEKLHNVSNKIEAQEAKLMYKPNIEKLGFEWDDLEDAATMNLQQTRESLKQWEILEALQPHTNIKSLSIKGYKGMNYPGWLDDTMLPNLENFSIWRCTNCNSIPPLGKFCKLKNIHIEGLPGVKFISHQFYVGKMDGKINRFPSLKELKIINMPNLEEWFGPEEGEFPFLERLEVRFCPKLTKMPNYFSTLKDLTLISCHQLACLPKCPSLDKLHLEECNEILLRWVPCLTYLSTLKILHFNKLKSLPEDMLQPLRNLKILKIVGCEKLVSLLEKDKGLPLMLRSLYILCCPNIKSLRPASLTSLENLTIRDCPQLIPLPESLPISLRHPCISGCPTLSE